MRRWQEPSPCLRAEDAVQREPPVHPKPEELGRFLQGKLSQPEARVVVRHLLTGCRHCRQVTRSLYPRGVLTSRDPTGRGIPKLQPPWRDRTMTEAEAAAQAALREIVKALSTVCLTLEGIHDSLPVSPQETAMLLGEEDMDVATEVRSVIECVLHDSLRPLIRNLQSAASYRLKKRTQQE
jgi:hypothetical protein